MADGSAPPVEAKALLDRLRRLAAELPVSVSAVQKVVANTEGLPLIGKTVAAAEELSAALAQMRALARDLEPESEDALAPAVQGERERDGVTGWAGKAGLRRRLSGLSEREVFLVSVTGRRNLESRFGDAGLRQVVLEFAEHLAGRISGRCEWYGWDGAGFVAVEPRGYGAGAVWQEIEDVLRTPYLCELRLENRTGLVNVFARGHRLLLRNGAIGALFDDIETRLRAAG